MDAAALPRTSSDSVSEAAMLSDDELITIERDAWAFAEAKAKASPGPWHQGVWYGHSIAGAGPRDREVAYTLLGNGENSCCVSAGDRTLLIGFVEDTPILSEQDARFIVFAKNTAIEREVVRLIDEIKRLRRINSEGA